MTISVSEGDLGQLQVDLLAFTEKHFGEAALALAKAIEAAKEHRFEDARAAQAVVRDMKAAFQLAMEERTKVDKLRKQAAGSVHGTALDLDAARAEIGRRLACLRDAGGD